MKSNSRKQLDGYRSTFFLVGLVLALFAVLTTLKYETITPKVLVHNSGEIFDESPIQIIPQTVRPVEPIPKQEELPKEIVTEIINPTQFKIILDGELDPFKDEYKDPDGLIPLLPSIDELDSIPVSEFSMDRYPIFWGCADLQKEEDRRVCLINGIHQEVANKLQVSPSGFGGRTKMFVDFTIGLDGKVKVTEIIRSPSRNIENQVRIIMEGLPQFIPGRFQGRARPMKMTLPILIVNN